VVHKATIKHRKDLCGGLPVHNCLEQGHVLSKLILSFTLERAIRKVHENQRGLKLKGIRQFLFFADEVRSEGGGGEHELHGM
jgi:hypothetical protein